MKRIFLNCFLFSIFPFIPAIQQADKFNSFIIYQYPSTRGYTTSAAGAEYATIREKKYSEIPASSDTLNLILSRAKVSILLPQKLPPGQNLFCEANKPDGVHHLFIVSSEVIDDLTKKKSYVIENTEDKKWINHLADRVYKTH